MLVAFFDPELENADILEGILLQVIHHLGTVLDQFRVDVVGLARQAADARTMAETKSLPKRGRRDAEERMVIEVSNFPRGRTRGRM